MSNDYNELMKKLQAKGYDAAKIATETGIPQPRIYNWLQGRANPRVKDAEILMELLEGKRKNKGLQTEPLDYVVNKILKIDATLEVFTDVLAELLARSHGLPVTGVLSDLKKSISEMAQVRQDELK